MVVDPPVKVATVVPLYLPWIRAGAELMLHSILSALARAGADVQVFVVVDLRSEGLRPGLSTALDGVSIRTVTSTDVGEAIAGFRPDVVVGQLGGVGLAAEYVNEHSATLIQVVHTTSPRTVHQLATIPAALTIFNTLWLQTELGHLCGRSMVIHPPLQDGPVQTPRSGHRVAMVNLCLQKGVDTFYDVAERLPQVQFLGVEGGYGKQVLRRDLPNVEIQLHTANMQADVWDRTRLLMVPSPHESFGMTAVEAASRGIPILAHRTPGLLEALGPAARFVDDLDGRTWADALNRILTNCREEDDLSRKAVQDRPCYDAASELKRAVEAILAL